MLKNALLISFAFIGTVVGAGFASGQEAMLYLSLIHISEPTRRS